MFDGVQLLGFLATVLVLVVVPGPNTMLILAHSVTGGRAAGLATVLGVELGTVIHTLATALGLSAVLTTSPLAFDLVRYSGAAYLTVVGLRELRRKADSSAEEATARGTLLRAFRRAVLNNVLNPKVAVFFLAFLPQFVRPERGHLVVQFLALGLIVSAVGLCVGSLLALAASQARGWLRNATVARWQQQLTAVVFLGLGLHLLLLRAR